jgi:hypothetical protein
MNATLSTTLSCTATVFWTRAHCPRTHTNQNKNNIVMSLPGLRIIETKPIERLGEASGRGVVVKCEQCGGLVEVLQHG